MFEQIVLGIIQGVFEWLPVSSEGMIVLAKARFFADGATFLEIIRLSLFLHFGTFLAALVYFWDEIRKLVAGLKAFKTQPPQYKNLVSFLLITTGISGCLGITLLKTINHAAPHLDATGKLITVFVGTLLLVTAYVQIFIRPSGQKNIKDINLMDSLILGAVQAFTVLPGLSRSGMTVCALLLRRFDKADSLKLSFLMSLPIVLGGNIILNLDAFRWSVPSLAGLVCSFVFGLLTIHFLLHIARRVNFGYFVLGFAILTIASTLI